MKKKLLALIACVMIVALSFCLAGCSSDGNEEVLKTNQQQSNLIMKTSRKIYKLLILAISLISTDHTTMLQLSKIQTSHGLLRTFRSM